MPQRHVASLDQDLYLRILDARSYTRVGCPPRGTAISARNCSNSPATTNRRVAANDLGLYSLQCAKISRFLAQPEPKTTCGCLSPSPSRHAPAYATKPGPSVSLMGSIALHVVLLKRNSSRSSPGRRMDCQAFKFPWFTITLEKKKAFHGQCSVFANAMQLSVRSTTRHIDTRLDCIFRIVTGNV